MSRIFRVSDREDSNDIITTSPAILGNKKEINYEMHWKLMCLGCQEYRITPGG